MQTRVGGRFVVSYTIRNFVKSILCNELTNENRLIRKAYLICIKIAKNNLRAVVMHVCSNFFYKISIFKKRSMWGAIDYSDEKRWMTFDRYFTEEIFWLTWFTSADPI